MLAIARNKWLSTITSRCTHFVTPTFKQAFLSAGGNLWHISRDAVRKTLWLLRDRLTKLILGRKGKLDFVPFIEDGRGLKRFHAHVIVRVPDSVPEQWFME